VVLLLGALGALFWYRVLSEKNRAECLQQVKALMERLEAKADAAKKSDAAAAAAGAAALAAYAGDLMAGVALSSWTRVTATVSFVQSDLVRSIPEVVWPYSFDAFSECAVPFFTFYKRYIAAVGIAGGVLGGAAGFLLWRRLQEAGKSAGGGASASAGAAKKNGAQKLKDVKAGVGKAQPGKEGSGVAATLEGIIVPPLLALSFRAVTCIPIGDGTSVLFGEPSTTCAPLSANWLPLIVISLIVGRNLFALSQSWRALQELKPGELLRRGRFALVVQVTNLLRMLVQPLVLVALDAQKVLYFVLTAATVAAARLLLADEDLEESSEDSEEAAKAKTVVREAAIARRKGEKLSTRLINLCNTVCYALGFATDALVFVSKGPEGSTSSAFSSFLPQGYASLLPWLFLASYLLPLVAILATLGSNRDVVLDYRRKATQAWGVLHYIVYGVRGRSRTALPVHAHAQDMFLFTFLPFTLFLSLTHTHTLPQEAKDDPKVKAPSGGAAVKDSTKMNPLSASQGAKKKKTRALHSGRSPRH
jgi:hypothetical protein